MATVPAEHNESQKIPDPDGNIVEVGGVTPTWSPGGGRVAWRGSAKSRVFIVVDGKPGESFQFADGLTFSSDGRHVAWRAGNRTADNQGERWAVYLDGKSLGEHDVVGPPRFHPDGGSVAYWAARGVKVDAMELYVGGQYFVVNGDKPDPALYPEADYFLPPAFSRDGKTLGYSAQRKPGEWVCMVGGRAAGTVEMADGPVFGRDASLWAFAGLSEGRWWVFSGKKRLGGEHANAGFPEFLPDGKTLAWIAEAKGKQAVIVNGRLVGEWHDAVLPPAFSQDGKHVAFAANRGGTAGMGAPPGPDPGGDDEEPPTEEAPAAPMTRGSLGSVEGGEWFVVVDGKAGERFDQVADVTVQTQGKGVAFRARRGNRWQVIAGTTRSEEYDAVGPPAFSPDGARVAFGARNGLELWWKVMEWKPDGKAGPDRR